MKSLLGPTGPGRQSACFSLHGDFSMGKGQHLLHTHSLLTDTTECSCILHLHAHVSLVHHKNNDSWGEFHQTLSKPNTVAQNQKQQPYKKTWEHHLVTVPEMEDGRYATLGILCRTLALPQASDCRVLLSSLSSETTQGSTGHHLLHHNKFTVKTLQHQALKISTCLSRT